MLHGMRRRISRSWLTAAAVVATMASRTTSVADAPPLFPEAMSGDEIQLALEKLNVLGRVLYVAAHPDDENTNLMAFWANGSLYDSGYLSVTRGDGGQNLLGPELGERLGVIRTEELLDARRIDHGKQFFTRAIDFGFSKTADETLRIWDRDKNRFPEQLAFVKPWRPTRLVWNTSPFFFKNRNLPFDPTGLTVLEAGGYNPLLGKAYTEIAAASLSMHKSQGVGRPLLRGARKEYFKLLEGEPMTSALFDGVDTSWSRVANSEPVAAKIRQIISDFHPADPAASVAELLELRQALSELKDGDWVPEKKAELDQIIAACLGLHVETSTTNATITPGQTADIKLEAINRCNIPVTLQEVRFPLSGDSTRIDAGLPPNELVTKDLSCKIPANTP